FLLMDEPTNHLDLIGKEALEESLKDYEGTMLFVSHDRYFISKLATAILVIDDGKASYYPLTYEEYMNRDKAQPVEKKQQPEKKESA
ncbi:MAG TPA: ABC transporter ATP-binding protein, partial [Erysipelotrichaceae bacterium]|nr:ABC transporter ATP-binding protein [Erysipelotrichaceae bacterium]